MRASTPVACQSFCGVLCPYGEDRALTNAILQCGFDTVCQASAVVCTLVPQNYTKLCKMYLRWDHSYVREGIALHASFGKDRWCPG